MLRRQVKTLLFLIIFFLSFGMNAQSPERGEDDRPAKGTPAQQELQGGMGKLMESFGMEKEDLQEIQREAGGDPQKMMKLMRERMQKRQAEGGGSGGNSRSLSPKDFLAGNAEETTRQVIKPFTRMTEARLVNLLGQQKVNQASPLGQLDDFLSSEKNIRFFARLLRDPQALPKLASILDNRRKLLYFVGANIALFIVTFYLKRRHRLKHPGMGLFGSLFHWAVRFAFMSVVRLGVTIAFFKNQFSPAWKIFERTFL